ncbi:hypothetical protein NPIL_520981 [Nephila pilipes]|uniref:Uncharacterized protein n=1 Tax=Nephila pilipes TaxID=299642 RepID=A0A8X6TIG9_NEPPI|nr:hypothetical protein NPIL_520981 [Nephila pilipes]
MEPIEIEVAPTQTRFIWDLRFVNEPPLLKNSQQPAPTTFALSLSLSEIFTLASLCRSAGTGAIPKETIRDSLNEPRLNFKRLEMK